MERQNSLNTLQHSMARNAARHQPPPPQAEPMVTPQLTQGGRILSAAIDPNFTRPPPSIAEVKEYFGRWGEQATGVRGSAGPSSGAAAGPPQSPGDMIFHEIIKKAVKEALIKFNQDGLLQAAAGTMAGRRTPSSGSGLTEGRPARTGAAARSGSRAGSAPANPPADMRALNRGPYFYADQRQRSDAQFRAPQPPPVPPADLPFPVPLARNPSGASGRSSGSKESGSSRQSGTSRYSITSEDTKQIKKLLQRGESLHRVAAITGINLKRLEDKEKQGVFD